MWIVSQDGSTLAYCTRLSVHGRTIQNLPTTGIEDDFDVLGKYETNERAKEVLRDISHEISSYYTTSKTINICNATRQQVYVMPKE